MGASSCSGHMALHYLHHTFYIHSIIVRVVCCLVSVNSGWIVVFCKSLWMTPVEISTQKLVIKKNPAAGETGSAVILNLMIRMEIIRWKLETGWIEFD